MRLGDVNIIRLYRIALIASLAVNGLLILGIWAYLHFEATLAIVEEAVGYF